MVKVKFLKDHLDNKKGDVIEVTKEMANYFVVTGIAKNHKEEKAEVSPKEDKAQRSTKEDKVAHKTK